jgi:hypothetical protein
VAKSPRPAFLHAFRFDGSVLSICPRCQMTIASKSNEIDLRKPEDAHLCANFSLSRILKPGESGDFDLQE